MDEPQMEPDLVTDERLLGELAELQQWEPIFHRREHVGCREDFERQTAAGFWEVGASGRRYSRQFVWSVLRERLASGEEDSFATDTPCSPRRQTSPTGCSSRWGRTASAVPMTHG